MKVEILGAGCQRCEELFQAVTEAVQQSQVSASVIKVKEVQEILNRGVFITPAISIDGEIVSSGKVPGRDELIRMLNSAASVAGQ
jgi:small redox-active disulfide protein 2